MNLIPSTFFRVFLPATLILLAGAAWSLAADPPLADYSLDGKLQGRGAGDRPVDGEVTRGTAAQLKWIEGPKGQGLYLSEGISVLLPVEKFNPQEGTILFWFRPDWMPPCNRATMIIEIAALPAWRLSFRKGYSHEPNYTYLTMDASGDASRGAASFSAHNLFTARQWRQYTIRWSAQRKVVDVLVDGDSEGRTGSFKCETAGPLKAEVLLSGNALGAFADVKVFDRYLELDDIIRASGLTHVATYLQRQKPPPGAAGRDVQRMVAYVDPATGQRVEAAVPGDTKSQTTRPYNPAAMPELRETPHTKWARPLAGGPVRALLVLPTSFYDGYTSLLRDGIEIWQRLDLQCDITNQPLPEVLGKDYDVIVVSHQGYGHSVSRWLGWTDLDPKLRAWILERVKSGRSGLVLVHPKQLDDEIGKLFDPKAKVGAERVLRGFPTAAMPQFKPVPYAATYALDESFFETAANLSEKVVEVFDANPVRLVRLNYEMGPGWPTHPGLTPDAALNGGVTLVHHDYWMSLVARAMLYAAKREPPVRILAADVTGSHWKISVEGLAETVALHYRARDIWGREYTSGQVNVKADGEVAVKAVALPPRTIVDLWLKDRDDRVSDWYAAAVPPATEAVITGIKLDQDQYEKGGTVRGVAQLASQQESEFRLEVFLADHSLRRLARHEGAVKVPAGGKAEAPFALAIPVSSDSLLMRVEALLLKDGAPVDTASADCPVPRQRFDGFWHFLYGAVNCRPLDTWRRLFFRDEYEANASARSGANYAYGMLARDNLNQLQEVTHLGYPGGEQPDYDMTARDKWEEFFPKNLNCDPQKVRPFRPIFWSLGEEHYAAVMPTSPTANARFRAYLQRKYGSLAKLNEVWKAGFAAWDDVKLPGKGGLTDVMKLDYAITEFEKRRFTEQVFADRHAYLADYMRKLDPGGDVGIHVGWDLWMGRGYDYWLLSRAMEAMICYNGPQNQYVRSFFKNYYGLWFHYCIGSEEDARWHPWHALASGARGVGWYTLSLEIWGALTADLHLSSDWAAAGPEIKDATVIGQLLTRTEYQQDQVAIHYSQDSFHAGVGPALSYIHDSFINLFFDGGVPFRFVSYQQVAEGELTKARYPLLVLPHSISLTESEVRAIRAYVQDGGRVWADILPGTYNHFAQKLETSQLADLFANLQDAALPGGQTLKAGKCGKGMVILGDIGNYVYARNVGNHLPAQTLLDRVVEMANLQRVGRVVNRADGKLANGIWTAGYRCGNQRYVVAVKDYRLADQNPADVRVDLPEKGHVYDLRSGRYFGETDQVDATLETARGKVFAVLPYRVEGLKLKAAGRPVRGRDLILRVGLETKMPVGPDDDHVIRVKVFRPDAREEVALRRWAVLAAGQGEVALPIAFDDPKGKWTVTVKDTATGVEKKIPYIMK